MNILAARIDTSRDGVALDAFRVSHEGADDARRRERWERVEHTLREVLAGTRSTSRSWCPRSSRPSILHDDSAGRCRRRSRSTTPCRASTRCSTSTPATASACCSRSPTASTTCGCEIHLAKITTMVDQVLDVFYVTDSEGRKIEDPARLEQIRQELVRALSPAPPAAAGPPGAARPRGQHGLNGAWRWRRGGGARRGARRQRRFVPRPSRARERGLAKRSVEAYGRDLTAFVRGLVVRRVREPDGDRRRGRARASGSARPTAASRRAARRARWRRCGATSAGWRREHRLAADPAPSAHPAAAGRAAATHSGTATSRAW